MPRAAHVPHLLAPTEVQRLVEAVALEDLGAEPEGEQLREAGAAHREATQQRQAHGAAMEPCAPWRPRPTHPTAGASQTMR